MENKVNTGVLFKNDKKTSPNQPDYRGKGNSFGKEVEIAAWIKQGKNGSFLSLSFSEPYVVPVSEPISQASNDDFPF
jgi:hypothetical protein